MVFKPEKFLDNKGRLKTWPAKKGMKIEVLKYVADKFEGNRFYTEKEVNNIIENWHTFGDYFLVRRSLIDSGLLERTRNGSKYWKTDSELVWQTPNIETSDGDSTPPEARKL